MPRVMTARGQELLEEYPFFLRKDHVIRAICNAAGEEFVLLDQEIGVLQANVIPFTAEEHLVLYENMLGLAEENPDSTLQERKDAVINALSRATLTEQGRDWETVATQIMGTGWTYSILDPNKSVVEIVFPLVAGSIQAELAEAFLRAVTPATMLINVSHSAGFILDESMLDDDTL